MAQRCLNCNKPLPKGVQSTFCSRQCWQEYKEKRGLSLSPEKQATVMIKERGANLISSLKSEIEKKDEIIRHQDKLLKEYRDSLENREREIDRLHRKIKQLDQIIHDLKKQVTNLQEPIKSSSLDSTSSSTERVLPAQPEITSVSQMDSSHPHKKAQTNYLPEVLPNPPKLSFWKRVRIFFFGY